MIWLAVDGKIKYRAIVSDLDGTLLDPSGNLSDVTVETLNILQRRGWKSSLQRALRRGCARDRGWAGFSPVIVSCNGAMVNIEGQAAADRSYFLPAELQTGLIDFYSPARST